MDKKKGVINYAVSAEAQDTSYQSVMSAALLKKSEFNFMFKGKKKARVQLKAGKFFEFVTIFDYRKKKYLKLLSSQETKSAELGEIIPLTDSAKAELTKYNLLEDTAVILGFKCKKATFESKYGELECWYTNDLEFDFKRIDFLDVDVPGLPLMFMTTTGKVTLTFIADNFEEFAKEHKALLSTKIPDDHEVVAETKKDE